MYIANNVLKHHLKSVYFIGGTACGGKTTMAKKIAEKYDMLYYNADDAMVEHFKLATAAEQPQMSVSFSSAEEYFNRPIDEYSKWIIDINNEALSMIIVDLLKLVGDKPIIAEGHFDADLLKPITSYNSAVFLYAEPDLLRSDYYTRGDKKPMVDAINALKDPEKVFNHTLDLGVNITSIQLNAAKSSNMKFYIRNPHSTIENTFKELEEHFKLA